jgi:NAD(P)-dependent dehydrogenase (short-subunit alcohol dehydrogenase family)
MDLGIEGKKAIVCASSRGLGKGCAWHLADAGCDVIVNGRNVEVTHATVEEIKKASVRSRNERIHLLQVALKKMDAGSYGQCEGCDEWIDYARLEQRPEANLCGDCAR